jgi:Glu-tRNA(Gln) amidotransferase subunit E-like FAD-binding protein
MQVDYKKLGMKSGLEIHQQLDTGKLFSRTPSLLRSEKPDYEVKRKLHRVAGETGEVDSAVEYEAGLGKEFVYQGYDDTISLLELDEEPPREIDSDALEEAIKIALLLNCNIYPIAQVMRKTVIDGSNTGGFQRTVLIGHDGYVECSFGKVSIGTVALEEDSARLISRGKERVVFRLDRLGIPLVEIMTGPELKTAEQVKETALKIGEILRAAKVKRGIGTIRQDVNVSIKGHDRVEIKGFQDPKMMIKTIDLEVRRQEIEKKKGKSEGEVRKALDDGKTEFLRPIPGQARMYPETDLPLLRIERDEINKIKKNLPKLRDEIKGELKKKGVSEELIGLVVSKGLLQEFENLMRIYNKDGELVAKMISLWRDDFCKKSKKSFDEVRNILNEDVLEDIMEAIKDRKIVKGDVREVMKRVMGGENIGNALSIKKVDENLLEEQIRKIVKEKPGLRPNAYMGLVMGKVKGIDARKAMEIIIRVVGE